MRSVLATLTATILAFGTASVQAGTTHTFVPDPANLDNLDHFKYYSWGINWKPVQNEVVTEAVLIIKNIWDWQVEEGDRLYTHLLSSPAMGFTTFHDDEGGGDAWNMAGPLVGVYTDPVGGVARNFDLVYKFSDLGLVDDLNELVQDGLWGPGFDPDCHYWNDGASLTVTTEVVPEPASLIALSFGLSALAKLRRRS